MADGKNKSNHYSPVKQQGNGGFKNFLWNPSTGEFLGRTGMSWFKITVFYIFFFAGLAAFFGLMLYIFLLTLNPGEPKWIGTDGLIGGNPGIGFRPMPDQDKNVESTLIWFNRNTESNNSYWTRELNTFFEKHYKNTPGSASSSSPACTFENGEHAAKDKACNLDASSMLSKPCSKEESGFGYQEGVGKPCVLIKLNKIFKWVPEPYNTTEDIELARKKGMPESLIKRIEGLISDTKNEGADPVKKRMLNTIWVSCEGENPADRENMGELQYYSAGVYTSKAGQSQAKEFPGIPGYFFPFLKQDTYKAPFVFVKFTNPQPNVLIQIECKAWAKNIEPDRQQRLGSVHFELMID